MVAAAQAQSTRNTITLKGSTAIVTEFFGYAVNRYVVYVEIVWWMREKERERERENMMREIGRRRQ